jgi:hypothetical protein
MYHEMSATRRFPDGVGDCIHKLFTTRPNKFGLFRQYTTEIPPSHDPELHLTPEDLHDQIDRPDQSSVPPELFYPYPNQNAYCLGDWYWNGGAQKSQASFKELVDIVGSPEFSPEDVHNVKWDSINHVLANDDNWTDEDAGWEKTNISINVPFQRRCGATSSSTGTTQEYVVTDFYHRNVVSVSREKLLDPANRDFFNYKPYELRFQPGRSSNPTRVYGELYTSQAFIDTHLAPQDQPPEPNCSLS